MACIPVQDSTPRCLVVPYKAIVTGGMYPGRSIAIEGFINPSPVSYFVINLRFNEGIAFHFNPRFNVCTVVRNSFLNGGWGPEELSGDMPFYPGQPFKITITSDSHCYKVYVNGAQMFVYQHRYHTLKAIDILEVDGDLSLTSVDF